MRDIWVSGGMQQGIRWTVGMAFRPLRTIDLLLGDPVRLRNPQHYRGDPDLAG